MHQALYQWGKSVSGVKNGRDIHKNLSKNRPKILQIPEENKQSRKNQPHTDIEQEQADNGVEQHEKRPCDTDTFEYAKQKENDQGHCKIDQGLYIFCQQE